MYIVFLSKQYPPLFGFDKTCHEHYSFAKTIIVTVSYQSHPFFVLLSLTTKLHFQDKRIHYKFAIFDHYASLYMVRLAGGIRDKCIHMNKISIGLYNTSHVHCWIIHILQDRSSVSTWVLFKLFPPR